MECYDCDKPAKIILGEKTDSSGISIPPENTTLLIPLCKEHAKIRIHKVNSMFGSQYTIKDGDIYEEIFEKQKIIPKR